MSGRTFWEPEELDAIEAEKKRKAEIDKGDVDQPVLGYINHRIPLSDDMEYDDEQYDYLRKRRFRNDDFWNF